MTKKLTINWGETEKINRAAQALAGQLACFPGR